MHTEQTPRTLETAATEYARTAVAEIIQDPQAYGIRRRWESLDEYIEFEFNGDAGDEASRLAREFGVPYKEAADTLKTAYRSSTTLAELNEPFGDEDEDQDGGY